MYCSSVNFATISCIRYCESSSICIYVHNLCTWLWVNVHIESQVCNGLDLVAEMDIDTNCLADNF